jgi:hypothetical protein
VKFTVSIFIPGGKKGMFLRQVGIHLQFNNGATTHKDNFMVLTVVTTSDFTLLNFCVYHAFFSNANNASEVSN